jgi:UDP-N-acetyl-2-amino-2-deoxyglucuronate dehydrogenase
MTIHIGIWGGGGISDTHARAAAEIEGVSVVALGGANSAKVKAIADRYDAAVYTDIEALVRHRPMDVLLIGTPSALHAEAGISAARAGLHVLMEKPLDVTTEKSDAVISACAKAGVKLGVFFQDRFAPDMVRLKTAIDEGALGRPLLGSARVKWWRPTEYYSASRWRGKAALDGGGAVMNQGIHTVDLLLWLWGDVTRVFARQKAALHQIEVEDTLVATLEFANGALATFEATTAAFPGYPRQIELSGTEGTIIVQQDRILSVDLKTPRADLEGGAGSANAAASSPVVSDVRGHKAVIEDFLRAIRDGSEPRCNGAEGRRSVTLVEALYRSARTGAPVEVSVG